jgi:hypothetical protein
LENDFLRFIIRVLAFMPRKFLDDEGNPHANSPEVAPEGRFLPAGVGFGSLRVRRLVVKGTVE